MYSRHLTVGQRAIVAVRVKPLCAEEAKRRQIANQNNDRGRAVKENFPEQDYGQARDKGGQICPTLLMKRRQGELPDKENLPERDKETASLGGLGQFSLGL